MGMLQFADGHAGQRWNEMPAGFCEVFNCIMNERIEYWAILLQRLMVRHMTVASKRVMT
jgi:hypothetical protein